MGVRSRWDRHVRERLHFAESLRAYAHCRNCDWMINLVNYHRRSHNGGHA